MDENTIFIKPVWDCIIEQYTELKTGTTNFFTFISVFKPDISSRTIAIFKVKIKTNEK